MRRTAVELFPWDSCGQPLFDRIVEALLTEMHRDGPGTLEAMDGRGGDGGIDLDLTMPDGTIDTIYQLKYFPEGFSGGHRARRRQIEKSFKAAMKHTPRRWVLVVPGNLTTEERKFVRALAQKYAGVEIGRTWGRAALDAELARLPRVFKYFTRDQRMEDLRIAGLERQGLASAADIAEYATSMGESLSSQSMHWDLHVTTGPEGVTTRVSARHPRAMEYEPLEGRISFVPGRVGEEARQRLEDARAFGTPVDLDAAVLAKVELTGTDWFAQELTDVGVHLRPPQSERRGIDLRVVTTGGDALQILRGDSTGHTGTRGRRILIKLDCGLDLTITVLDSVNPPADLNVSVERLRRDDAVEAARAVQFLAHLESGAEIVIELWRDGNRFVQMRSNSDSEEGKRLIGAYEQQLIDDLRVLSRRFDITLRVPDEMTVAQRTEIRKARLLAEGKVILDSDLAGLDIRLSGIAGEPIDRFLKDVASMVLVETKLQYLVDGQPLTFPVRAFHPRAHVVDASTVAAALEAGTAANMPVTIRGVDHSPLRVYSVADFPPEQRDLAPTPLELVLPEDIAAAMEQPPSDA
jgi:hypothetical protein